MHRQFHRDRRALGALPPLVKTPTGKPRAGGQGRGGRGGRGGAAVATQTTHVQRMSVQREVELSGTLLSPDMAKISSEVAGIVREVRVQLGTEVRAGDVLVRLEPRELKLALDRAESALRQVEAQLGIDRASGQAAAGRRADRVGPPGRLPIETTRERRSSARSS